MIKKRGFLLLELIGALFLLSICITLYMNNTAYSVQLVNHSLKTYQQVVLAQNALEKARLAFKEATTSFISDVYNVETIITRDNTLKNFLHIVVSVYDKEKKGETWFSGVALPYEAT